MQQQLQQPDNAMAELRILRTEYEQYTRFQQDLEFVNMLANPFYLKRLAEFDYFSNERFLNYLKYLEYFKQPEYFKFVKYPLSIKMLDTIQKESFIQKITGENALNFAKYIAEQITIHKMFLDKLSTEKELN